jgi:hypothetical protein
MNIRVRRVQPPATADGSDIEMMFFRRMFRVVKINIKQIIKNRRRFVKPDSIIKG